MRPMRMQDTAEAVGAILTGEGEAAAAGDKDCAARAREFSTYPIFEILYDGNRLGTSVPSPGRYNRIDKGC